MAAFAGAISGGGGSLTGHDQLGDECKLTNEPDTTFATFSLLLAVIGLFGNLIIIMIILTLREYRKSAANWFVQLQALPTVTYRGRNQKIYG